MDTTIITVQGETLTYSGYEFLTPVDSAKATLDKFGVAVIRDRLTQDECDQMNEGMWETAEFLTSQLDKPLVRSRPRTYASIFQLMPKAGGLFQNWGWGHAQYVWDVRTNPKVGAIFEEVFDTEDLLVSFDGINCGLGPLIPGQLDQDIRHKGMYQGKHNLHCDQRFSENSFSCIQSWVTANATLPGDGTLRILQGSHLLHAAFREAFKDQLHDVDKDWCVLTDDQVQWYKDRGCKDISLVCPAGSQVCWDSRTIHCGMPALRTQDLPASLHGLPRSHRNVVYVCMAPRSLANPGTMDLRRAVMAPGSHRLKLASHWPQYMSLFPSRAKSRNPRIAPPKVPEVSMPVLTERGRRLAGLPENKKNINGHTALRGRLGRGNFRRVQ